MQKKNKSPQSQQKIIKVRAIRQAEVYMETARR
jgi:hypothetical protein